MMAEHYQAPVLGDDMKARLATGGTDPIPVAVTFASALASSELEALGLYASTAQPSEIAYGTLAPDPVRALAARTGVKSISFAAILPARPGAPDKSTAIDKVQPVLRTKLDARPTDEQAVIVYFRGRVTKETLKSLGLSEMVDDAGRGNLDEAGVLRLAERPDVRRIEAVPEMRPSR